MGKEKSETEGLAGCFGKRETDGYEEVQDVSFPFHFFLFFFKT